MDSLELDLNNLIYEPNTDPSVAIQRQLVLRYPEKTTYKNGEKMTFIFNGTMFIDGQNSSLSLGLKVENLLDPQFSFGTAQGSIFNIANRVRVISPSGEALSDLVNFNAFTAINNRMKLSSQYHSIVGNSFGSKQSNFAVADTHYFQLPLRMLSPFFNSDQLIPPMITDGMIIEIYLETPQQAISSGVAATSYQILNPEIVLDTTQLADQYLKLLSNTPMTYEYTDVVQSSAFMPSNDSQLTHEIPYSLSTATEAIAILRKQSILQNGTVNSFKMIGPKLIVDVNDSMQWKLGSLQFPQQPSRGSLKIYNTLLSTQRVLASTTCDSFDIPYDASFATEIGVYSVDLCRSRTYANSGRELSNGQRLSITIKQSIAENYVMDVFVYHTCRCVGFNNIVADTPETRKIEIFR